MRAGLAKGLTIAIPISLILWAALLAFVQECLL